MTDDKPRERIQALEAVLMDYIERYGLTTAARKYFIDTDERVAERLRKDRTNKC